MHVPTSKAVPAVPGHYGIGGNSGGDGGDQGREREAGGERLGTKG